ncbi:MAG: asparagine synthase-related protein [Anaerolineae bacterium]
MLVIWSGCSELIWHLEDLRVGQSYPNYYVARLASRFVKVALSGREVMSCLAATPGATIEVSTAPVVKHICKIIINFGND